MAKSAKTTVAANTGIPAQFDRTKDPKAIAAAKVALKNMGADRKIVMPPRTPSEVPQPKLAHGNTGIHSRQAVIDNAKAARAAGKGAQLPTNIDRAKKSPAKPTAGKVAANAAKATPAKKSAPVAKVATDRKITPVTKTIALREGTWTHFMVATAIVSKTTFAADALVTKSKAFSHKKMDWSWLVAKGHVKLS